MSEESTETPEPGTPEPAPAPEAPKAPDKLPGDHPLVTAYERVKKELTEARTTLQSIEDEKKTDGEKLTDRLTQAEQRAQEAEVRALRLEVAADKGLTPKQAGRLVGKTKEELEADADDLLEQFPAKTNQSPPSTKPSPTARGGTDPTNEPIDVGSLVESIPPTA